MQATLKKVEQHTKWWNQEVELFALDIEKAFLNNFPHSLIHIRPSIIGYGVTFQVTLGANKDEYENRIHNNDPMHIIYHVNGFNQDGTFAEKMSIESSSGGSLTVAPEAGSYLYCSYIKTFRKLSGNKEKLVVGIQKHFAKLHETVKANADSVQQFTPVNVLEKLAK